VNNQYNVSITLNYTESASPITGTSYPIVFWYEKDTRGDGLTDWAKVRGWEVTYTQIGGVVGDEWVSANPLAYATNGLVSDYLEKEFGLNPTTLDTASSGMLDTWNLTFELGSGSPTLPGASYFNYYYENSTYNFSKACQEYVPGGGSCPLASHAGPLLSNLSAISPSQTGDSTPWAAAARWSGVGTTSALAQLEALIVAEGVGPFRATTGSWGSDRTITVWGKLSWGANPLAQSTRLDDIADGYQPDPLMPRLSSAATKSSRRSCSSFSFRRANSTGERVRASQMAASRRRLMSAVAGEPRAVFSYHRRTSASRRRVADGVAFRGIGTP
jgi:hypothetical protein